MLSVPIGQRASACSHSSFNNCWRHIHLQMVHRPLLEPCGPGRARCIARVAQRPLLSLLSEIESLKASADELEVELSGVSQRAEVAAKRSRRLAARSQELQAYALEHIMLGDEGAARSALQQKAAVAEALAQATRRAEANSALARKLEEVLVLKQSQLLAMIREANRQQAAAEATAAASCASTSPKGAADAVEAGPSSRGLKRSASVAWSSPSLHASSDEWLVQGGEPGSIEAVAADAAAAVAEEATAAAQEWNVDHQQGQISEHCNGNGAVGPNASPKHELRHYRHDV